MGLAFNVLGLMWEIDGHVSACRGMDHGGLSDADGEQFWSKFGLGICVACIVGNNLGSGSPD